MEFDPYDTLIINSGNHILIFFHLNCSSKHELSTILIYRVFSLMWPTPMQIYWNKRKPLHKKRVQLPKDSFGTPTWLPFHCFGTPIWPPSRHVKTLYSHVSVLIQIIVPAIFILYYYFWSLNNDPLIPHTNPCIISVMQHRFSFMTLEYLWRPVYIHNIQSVFQLILGGHLDNLRGHPDHVLIFFVIFNLMFIFHLSSQEAFLVGPLTRDPFLIWNIDSAG